MVEFHYYVLVQAREVGGAMFGYGPFASVQERDDFTCALWFGLPARLPGYDRRKRLSFNQARQLLYYTAVSSDRLMNIRGVTVGDIGKGATFPREKAAAGVGRRRA